MKEVIEKFWSTINELDAIDTPEKLYQFMLKKNSDAAEKFKQSNFDYDIYFSKYPNGLSFLTESLKQYFDNPEFLKELKLKEKGIQLQFARNLFPEDMFLKICNYFEENYRQPYLAFKVETQSDYEFLLSRGFSNEEIFRIIDNDSLPFMFDNLIKEDSDFSSIISYFKEYGSKISFGKKDNGNLELVLKMIKNNKYSLLEAYLRYYNFKELAPSFFEALANSDIQDISDVYKILDDIDSNFVTKIDISTIVKLKNKYGNKIIKYVENPSKEVIDMFLDISLDEYKSCSNLSKSEKLFNKFFNEGNREIVFNAEFDEFSDESIINIINKLSNDEIRNYSSTNRIGFKSALRRALVYSIKKNDLNLVRKILENIDINEKFNYLTDESLLDSIIKIKTIDRELFIKAFKVSNIDIKAKLIKEDKSLIDYCNRFVNLGEKISDCFSSNIPWEIIDLCKNNKQLLIKRYDEIESFITKNGIDMNKFIQYAIENKQEWVSQILFIIDNDESNFMKFSNYFKEGVVNYPAVVDSFLLLINNYSEYPELCFDIISQNRELTEEEKNQVIFLFGRTEVEEEIRPKTIKDCSIFFDTLIKHYKEQQSLIDTNPELFFHQRLLEDQKELLCNILFNCSLATCIERLDNFGNIEELRKMIFNDRGNSGIELNIREIMVLTSMMEDIVYCEDLDLLKQLFSKCLDNFDLVVNCSKYFTDYEKYMKKLYEKETKSMLTSISSIVDKDKIIDREVSKKLGRTVYDFSDKKYILLAHVKSRSETVEELVTGVPQKGHNYISFSPISNRDNLHHNSLRITFVYDTIPDDSFIRSSRESFFSNGLIGRHSTDIKEAKDHTTIRRGILESSIGIGAVAPETLCFREGIKPIGISVPIDRELTDQEKEVLEQYPELAVIRTQPEGKRIESPKTIETIEEENKKVEELKQLKKLKSKLFDLKKNTPRRIAIFTDSHGLFEPTLAILEDARRQGITEVYSLGDNIGSGPNPGEVIDLLEEYGVKSVVGNHELYLTKGVDSFSGHLSLKAMERAKKNRSWTEKRLTEKQKEKIKQMPEKIEVELGGKKVLLTHYTRDYNTGEEVVSSDDYDDIFQGHVHFEEKDDKITTLRGVGIGYNAPGSPSAAYIILEEKPDGGFRVIPKKIKFDNKNMDHSITESSMSEHDEKKIVSWSRSKAR